MTEHKITDEQIISALEVRMPHDAICREALDLINRQRAEIDDLTRDTIPKLKYGLERANEMGRDLEVELKAMRGAANSFKMHYENAKAEAVKEFAERLKERHYFHASCVGNCYQMSGNNIDNLVKEMTRRCPNCKHFVGCETACGGEPCDSFE